MKMRLRITSISHDIPDVLDVHAWYEAVEQLLEYHFLPEPAPPEQEEAGDAATSQDPGSGSKRKKTAVSIIYHLMP